MRIVFFVLDQLIVITRLTNNSNGLYTPVEIIIFLIIWNGKIRFRHSVGDPMVLPQNNPQGELLFFYFRETTVYVLFMHLNVMKKKKREEEFCPILYSVITDEKKIIYMIRSIFEDVQKTYIYINFVLHLFNFMHRCSNVFYYKERYFHSLFITLFF